MGDVVHVDHESIKIVERRDTDKGLVLFLVSSPDGRFDPTSQHPRAELRRLPYVDVVSGFGTSQVLEVVLVKDCEGTVQERKGMAREIADKLSARFINKKRRERTIES